jgi:hypothetical protein
LEEFIVRRIAAQVDRVFEGDADGAAMNSQELLLNAS